MVATSLNPARNDVLLLDTNIVVIYARAGEPSLRLEEQLGLQSGRVEGFVSIVTVGEAIAFALKKKWNQQRQDGLMELVRTKLVPIDINKPEILSAYAEIDHFSEQVVKPARRMGKNDLWIAATAKVLNCELVTTDGDFDHLNGVKIRRRWIDQTTLKPGKP